MALSINETEIRTKIPNIFSVWGFINCYIELLKKYYGKDNEGNILPKPKLSLFDGRSYDKTYLKVEKITNKYKHNRSLLTSKIIKEIRDELKKYKGKESPAKLKYIEDILYYIGLTEQYVQEKVIKPLEDFVKNPVLFRKKSEERIKADMKLLETHRRSCREIQELYDLYEAELEARKNLDNKNANLNIITGLPNCGNYCFLNAAIQQLYGLNQFREKVLTFPLDEMDRTKRAYKELFAVKKLFEHLSKRIKLSNSEIEDYMGENFLGYKGSQEDSAEHVVRIMSAVKRQIKILEKKDSGKAKIIEIRNIFNLPCHTNTTLTRLIIEQCKEHNAPYITIILKSNQFCFQLTKAAKNIKIDGINEIFYTSPVCPKYIRFKHNKNDDVFINNPDFKLTGVTIHSGTSGNQGHYYIYRKLGDKWKCINDSRVEDSIKWNNIHESICKNATMLVYTKI